MSAYLFAYGTLQPGTAPAEIAPLVAQLKSIGKGSVRGILYDLGDYPGAILDPASQSTIAGTVFELPQDPHILSALDAYEEYDPAPPNTSLFIRVLKPVSLASGGALECWVYVWNGDPANVTIIPSGKFRG